MYTAGAVALNQDIGLAGVPDRIVAMVSGNFFRAVIPKDNFALAVQEHHSGAEDFQRARKISVSRADGMLGE